MGSIGDVGREKERLLLVICCSTRDMTEELGLQEQ